MSVYGVTPKSINTLHLQVAWKALNSEAHKPSQELQILFYTDMHQSISILHAQLTTIMQLLSMKKLAAQMIGEKIKPFKL